MEEYMKSNINRRSLIKSSLLSGAALVAAKASAACNLPTPEQTEGPFYPVHEQSDTDNNLIQIAGRGQTALGKKIKITGKVLDINCQPVAGALVEIWQACASGKYSHASDPNPARLDPNFQYWGKSVTNEKGEYSFLTIKPGAYPATSNWIRPPHIHFKVSLRGYEELTTQMYFKGEKHNNTDRILQSHSESEQKRLIVDFDDQPISQGNFELTLKAIE